MGRGVETVGDNVVYFDFTYADEHDYEDLANEDWQDLIVNLQSSLSKKYKSLKIVKDRFMLHPYRENMIILENGHVQVSISEYCGCGAVSVFINLNNEGYWPHRITLAEHWLGQCWIGIVKIIGQHVTALNKLGTFSNGVSIFEKKK